MLVTTPHWHAGRSLRLASPTQASPIDLWSAGLVGRFDAQAAAHPDVVAVDDGRIALTYRQLRDQAAALSQVLADLPDDGRPVAALMLGTVHYAIALMAALAAGRALVPVDMAHPLERRRSILDEARPGILLVDPDVAIEPVLTTDDRRQIAVRPGPAEPADWARTSGDPIIGVAFTSGSMGRPKGLAYRQSAILAMVIDHISAMDVRSGDTLLSLASLGAGGNQDILAAILSGARVRLLDLKTVGIAETLRVMTDEGVTHLSMIPLVFRTLMGQAEAGEAFSRIRAISTGGDRLYGKDIDLFRSVLPADAAIRMTQGSTETGVVFQWLVPAEAHFAPEDTVPSGYVGSLHEVAVTSSDDAASVIDGEPGELMVSGAHMAAGAWQAGRLTPGPFVTTEDGARRVFDTGDLMRRREDGLFEFAGRRDRQIKMRGLRGDPGEVEAALRRMADVDDVAVIPRYSGPEAVFVAYVVPRSLYAPPSAVALRSALGEEVPPHMIPAEIRFLQSLPRLANYKTDFAALSALDQASLGLGGAEAEAPVTENTPLSPAVTRAVAAAWTDILGSAPSDRAFDESGGDSLKLLQLALHLEQGLEGRLPLDLFDLALTPTRLAQRLSAMTPAAFAEADDGQPTVILCPGLGGDEPRLAAFRRALKGRVRFVVIDYPGLETSPSRLGDLDHLVDLAMRQASAAAPDGPVLLAGYSAGGIVALEMARRFQAQGRATPFTALLDLAAVRGSSRDTGYRGVSLREVLAQLDTRHRTTGFGPAFTNWAFFLLLRVKAFGLLRMMVLTKSRLRGPHSVTFVRKVLIEYMRGPAALNWRPRHFHGPLSLFRADIQRDPTAAHDLGWREWSDDLTVRRVPGDHLSMLSSPNVERLADSFGEALAKAMSDVSTPPRS